MQWTCEEHDCVVVHTSKQCPVCVEVRDLKAEVKELEKTVENLRDELLDNDIPVPVRCLPPTTTRKFK